MNYLRKTISNMGMPVRGVRGSGSLYKPVSIILFLLVFIPSISFAQLTGGTISTTKCQVWDADHFVQQATGITGQVGHLPIIYTWQRSQDPTFGSGVQTIGFSATDLLDTDDLSGTWYYRRRVDNNSNTAFSNIVQIVMMPSVTITGTLTVCQNSADPTLTITAVGGIAPYSITYSLNGAPDVTIATTTGAGTLTGTATISVPTNIAGTFTYSLTSVVDANSLSETCTNSSVSSGATITVSALPTATISANTLTACENTASTTPTVTITGAGGMAPYTFTYTVNGGSNLTVTSTGTTATITPPINVVGNIVYQLVSVQESSATACTNAQTSSVTIAVNAKPVFSSIDPSTPTICYGASFFNVTLTYTNSPTEYKLDWSPSAIADGFTNVAYASNNFTSGSPLTVAVPTATAQVTTYTGTLTVRNATTGCESDPGTAPFQISALPIPGITAGGPLTFCTGNSVNLTGTGGTGYLWSNGTNVALTNITTSGTYSVTVTNAAGCNAVTSTVVTVNALPTAGITAGGPLTFCAGNSVNLTGTGGTGYLWSNGTNVALTNITTSGTYSVTVTNAAGCDAVTSTVVTVNALPAAGITAGGPLTFCAGNSVNLTATGGTGYLWSNGTNVALTNITTSGTYSVTVTNAAGCDAVTSTVVTVNALPTAGITAGGPLTFCTGNSVNLTGTGGTGYLWSNGTNVALTNITTSGTYSVTVTNAAGCDAVTSTVVTVNALPTAGITAGGPLTFCAGNSVNLTGTGGTGYLWSNGTNVALTNITTSGTYSVTVTNAAGCDAVTSTVVTVNALPTAGITAGGPLTFCAGNSVNLTGTGGTGYLWSNGTNVALTNITTSGTYSVTVTNAAGCDAVTSTVVTVNALPAATITPSGGTTFCAGGSVNLTSSVGNSYLWSNATNGGSISNITTSGTYTVTVTDGNGCSNTSAPTAVIVNALPTATITPSGATTFCAGGSVNLTSSAGNSYLWSNATNGASISNITTSGTYTVTVTDGNGCSNTSAPTTIIVNALPTATIIPSGATTFCAGGSVNLTSSAANSYLWSNATTAASISNITTSGTYTVTVTDANGCQNTSAPTTITVNALPTPIINASGPLTFCTGNSVNLTASGGNTYSWSNGINTPLTNIVSSGTYSVTVTNAAGCTAVASRTVTVNPLPTPAINASGPLTFCAGNSVNLTASGGTSYVWSNTSTNASITNITTSGTYSVTVTDANNCSATSSPVTITVNANPTVVITNPAAICSPGTVDLTAASITTGSTSGLNYSYWTSAAATQALNTPFAIGIAGTYYIRGTNTVTNCSTIQPVMVNINPQAVMQINTPAAVCSPQTVDLTAAAITNGSAAGLSYTYFTNAAATTSLSNANAVNASGVYYIKGTPASGCSAVVPVTVTINPLPTLVINNPAAVCSPQVINLSDAAVTAGSSAGLNFAYFSNAALTTPVTNAQTVNNSGTFYIRATDATTGCARALPVTVQINAAPQGVLQTPATNIICENSSLTLNASGGNSYQWLLNQQPINGANASTYNATIVGNYAVRFISAQNCEAVSSNTLQLELLNKPTVQFTLANACAGVPTSFNNTSITSASGGINWLWDFGDGSSSNQFSPAHIYANAGTYAVRLTATSPVCNSFNETSLVTYRVQSALPAIRYKDVDVLKDIPATVTARAIGTSFLWLPTTGVNNNRIASPAIRVSTTTEYTVAITNEIGCTTTDTVLLKVIPGVDIYVPQGFTPNNDGQNDRLYPILVGMRQLNYFRVFNRWGHMIFTTKESSAASGWNGLYLGVMQPMGTYTWMAEAVDLQGNVVRKTGTVLLLQ